MPMPILNYENFKEEFLRRLNLCFEEKQLIRADQFPLSSAVCPDTMIATDRKFPDAVQALPLDKYWELYQKGTGFTALCGIFEQDQALIERTLPCRSGPPLTLTRFRQYLLPVLVPMDKYPDLEQLPYLPFLDMAVSFCVLLPAADSDTDCTALVDKKMAAWAKMGPEELYARAQVNLRRMFRPALYYVENGKKCALYGDEIRIPEQSGRFDYVLSLDHCAYGAAVLLWEGLLQGIADRSGCSFYLRPCITEAVFLSPAQNGEDVEQCVKALQDENSRMKALVPGSLLSERVYYYDRKKGLRPALPERQDRKA